MDLNKIDTYIDAYYKTNQRHLAWSFWASLSAVSVGLVVLVVGVGLAFAGSATAVSVSTTFAGALTEFIGAGFFYLYNKNLKQLNVFYSELVQSQDIFLALGLVGHVPEPQPDKIAALIGKILSRGGPHTELTPELVRAMAEANASKGGAS